MQSSFIEAAGSTLIILAELVRVLLLSNTCSRLSWMFLLSNIPSPFWIQNCFQVHNDCRRHHHENWSSKSLLWRRIWQKSECTDAFDISEHFQSKLAFLILSFPHFQMLLLRFRRFSQISACGYFTVDRSLVTSFLGTTFTYWVILVQFTQTVENWRTDLKFEKCLDVLAHLLKLALQCIEDNTKTFSLITNIKEVIFTALILSRLPKMVFCPILWPDSIGEQACRRWFRQIGHDGAGRLRWEMITALLLECLNLAPLRTFGENLWKYCWSQFFIYFLTLYPPHFFVAKLRKMGGIHKWQRFFTKVLEESVVNFFTTINFHHC